jgi:hypothetical protein
MQCSPIGVAAMSATCNDRMNRQDERAEGRRQRAEGRGQKAVSLERKIRPGGRSRNAAFCVGRVPGHEGRRQTWWGRTFGVVARDAADACLTQLAGSRRFAPGHEEGEIGGVTRVQRSEVIEATCVYGAGVTPPRGSNVAVLQLAAAGVCECVSVARNAIYFVHL